MRETFGAFVFGEVLMRRYRDGTVEILGWEGQAGRGRRAAEAWQCGPLLIDEGGYVDQDVVAEGTWRLEPSP